jgi:hypothetical protein
MDKDRELQQLHTLYGLMRVRGRYRYDADLVAIHQALPAEERDLVLASARELATSPEAAEAVGRGADQVLVEIACLTAGAMRNLASPALALRPNRGGFPPRRRLEAAGWLIQALDDIALGRALLGDLAIRERLRERFGPLPASDGSPADLLVRLAQFTARLPSEHRQLTRALHAAYQGLDATADADADAADRLARWAVRLLESEIAEVRELGEEVLRHLACFVPGSLVGVHDRLIELDVLHPGVLFRGAGEPARQALLDRVEVAAASGDTLGLDHALVALAWVADPTVQAAFWRWTRHAPPWAGLLLAPVHAYTQEAGWVPAEAGRRMLYTPECHQLVPAGSAGHGRGPAEAITQLDDRCRWCSSPLICLVDLDLADQRLAFLGRCLPRLQVAACERCSPYGVIFSELDGAGRCRWSDHSARPALLDAASDPDTVEPLPRAQLILGERRRSPFVALEMLDGGGSQVGGHPLWLSDAEYPECPSCSQPMAFVAQVQTSDLGEPAEGVWYAFVCFDCSIAASSYQQT